MSDETTPTTPTTPDAGAGGNSGTTPATVAQLTPYRAFATEAELTAFVQRSKSQAERSALRKLATDMGFEDADELREALAPLRRGQGGTQTATPVTPATPAAPQGPSEADRLKMALNVGAKLNLPATLVARLQGSTAEEMEADAQQLLGFLQAGGQRGPGIPSAPQSGQPVTFTQAQLADPKFVREHAAEIQQAAREGRIVRS